MSGGTAYRCLLCPEDAKGHVSFECERGKELADHLLEKHGLTRETILAAKSDDAFHLCGNGNSRSGCNFRLPDGRLIASRTQWWERDKAKPRARAGR